MQWQEALDLALKIGVPLLTLLAGWLMSELRDLKAKHSKLKDELESVKVNYVTSTALQITEQRITHYMDQRMADVLSKLDLMIGIMTNKNQP